MRSSFFYFFSILWRLRTNSNILQCPAMLYAIYGTSFDRAILSAIYKSVFFVIHVASCNLFTLYKFYAFPCCADAVYQFHFLFNTTFGPEKDKKNSVVWTTTTQLKSLIKIFHSVLISIHIYIIHRQYDVPPDEAF